MVVQTNCIRIEKENQIFCIFSKMYFTKNEFIIDTYLIFFSKNKTKMLNF